MFVVETIPAAHSAEPSLPFLPFRPPPARKVTARAPTPQRRRRPKRRRHGRLVAKTRFTVRLSEAESLALQARARREGCTPSDLVRDALYEQYRIGELEPATSDAGNVGRTH